MTFCPECESRVKLGANPRIGQRTVCPRCRAKLEVVGLAPLELDVCTSADAASTSGKKKKRAAVEAFCPECGHNIKLGGRPREGQQVVCTLCKAHLEVTSLDPLELDVPVAGWNKKGRKADTRRPKDKDSWF